MQIIISPLSGAGAENFLIDASPTDDVKVLRAACAQRLGIDFPERIKLVCEGLELQDGANLGDFYVTPLSTVLLVLKADASSPSPVSDPNNSEAPDFNVVLDAEMPRAVVVTGIPDSDAATTERCILDTFSSFGPIARIIFQSESSSRQHAVIIYHSEQGAAASLAADSTSFMGSPEIHVVLASSLLPQPSTGSSTASTSTGGPRRPTIASTVIADLLANGYLFGVQGVAHMKRLDSERGLSQRVSVVAENIKGSVNVIDQRYRVSTTVMTTYELAKQQALELDTRFGITQRVQGVAQSVAATAQLVGGKVSHHAHAAAAQAQTVAARAMENPQVAAAAQGAKDFFARASGVVGSFVDQALIDAKNIETRIKSVTSIPPTSSSPAMPTGPVDATETTTTTTSSETKTS
jgi:hypothetical protein